MVCFTLSDIFGNLTTHRSHLCWTVRTLLNIYTYVVSYWCTLTGHKHHIKMQENKLIWLKPFYYQLMHIMLKNTELLKHSKITLQHVSVYVERFQRCLMHGVTMKFTEHSETCYLKVVHALLLVSMVMNLLVPKMQGISWLAAEPVSFSRRTLLHGVSKYMPY